MKRTENTVQLMNPFVRTQMVANGNLQKSEATALYLSIENNNDNAVSPSIENNNDNATVTAYQIKMHPNQKELDKSLYSWSTAHYSEVHGTPFTMPPLRKKLQQSECMGIADKILKSTH
jgi:hypothetical protein